MGEWTWHMVLISKSLWNCIWLPCDEVRGSVEDLMAGFGGFESAAAGVCGISGGLLGKA